MEQIVVGMADCRIASRPEQVLATYALGSCIGLSLYDTSSGVAGMLHYMLPDSTIDPAKSKENPFMFADTGIPRLLEAMTVAGADRRRLVAKLTGGAKIIKRNYPLLDLNIGEKNVQKCLEYLEKLKIPVEGQDTGGSAGRVAEFHVKTGELVIRQRQERRL